MVILCSVEVKNACNLPPFPYTSTWRSLH